MSVFEEEPGLYPYRSGKRKRKRNYRSLVTLRSIWGDKIDVWKEWHSNKEAAMRRVEKLKTVLGDDYFHYQILDRNKKIISTDQVIETEKEDNNV